MRGIGSAEVEAFSTTEQLPPEALDLMAHAPGVFASRAWWNVVLSHGLPAGAKPSFLVIRTAGQITAVVPLLRTGGRLGGLTTPYTCDYAPLFAPGLDRVTRTAAMAAFGRFCRPAGMVRLDALPAEWDGLADLLAGVREAGLRVLRFDHFGNWFAQTGLGWSEYLLGRPGALRATVRRRLRQAEKMPDARFDILTRPEQMDHAAEAFETVYRRSWKDAEPYPTFNVALMTAMAGQGLLRLGIWSIGSDPVAVQLWSVKAGHATVLKLAHDAAYKAHSPGTVLTALMLRHLLDRENITQIDFGRGDDAYKQGWADQRRQRIGLLLLDPWRVAGAVALLRHASGRVWATFRAIPSVVSAEQPAPLTQQ